MNSRIPGLKALLISAVIVSALILFADTAMAAEILVFGDRAERDILAGDLGEMGHSVTVMPELPQDLSPYDTIWHVAAFVPLTASEQERLAAFLASGRGLHLTGERPCCEDLNDSLETLVNSVVIDGGITVGDQGDIGTPYPFNSAALGGITTTPNELTMWVPSASGGMLGFESLTAPNVFVTGGNGVVTGAVWDESSLVGGNGRLTLLMDVNWFSGSEADRLPLIENIQAFLEGGTGTGTPPCEYRCSADVPRQANAGDPVPFGAELIVEPDTCEVFLPRYEWSFGDGTTSNEQNPVKVYEEGGRYSWQLTIFTGDRSCSESGTITIACSFECDATVPAQGVQGETVAFRSTAQIDPSCNLPPPSFAWEFGDGTTSTMQNPGKVYSAPGTYEWSVTVTAGNATCRRTGTITIAQVCTLSCTADVPASAVENQLVSFASFATAGAFCPDSPPSFLWSFGDGTTSTEQNPAKVYSAPGSFTWQVTTTLGNLTCTRSGQISVTRAPALIAVTHLPDALVQPTTGGATTTYTVQNVGGTFTQVTITQTGNFFTQSPTTLLLDAGESAVVTITGLATAAGTFEGTVNLSGLGVPPDLSIPVRMLSIPPPEMSVNAEAEQSRIDVSSDPGEFPTGTAEFTNTTSGTINGILSADVPWIIPQEGIITIPPGQTVTVTFMINPELRGDEEYGTAVGSLILTYLNGTSGKDGVHSSHGRATASVPIHHTASPGSQPGQIPPLAEGEVALFLPGIANVTGSVGNFLSDIRLTNLTGLNLSGVDLFYRVAGSSTANSTRLNQIIAGRSLVLGDVAKSVFSSASTVGTLQIRSDNIDRLSASAQVFNTTSPDGTSGTALPVFRSDRSAGPGQQIFLSGLQSDATTHTNLYIQEVIGLPAAVSIDFYDADGVAMGGRNEILQGFGLVQLARVVPQGAVSAVLTTSAGSMGRLVAYATPVDQVSGDTWAVSDWPLQFGVDGGTVVIPVAASVEGADDTRFVTDVWILSTGSVTATGRLTFHPQSGDPISVPVSLEPLESLVARDILQNEFGISGDAVGYLIYTAETGEVVTTSRTYTSINGEDGTLGTSVPSVPPSLGITAGQVRRFGGVDDASRESILLERAGTYRTNLGVVEVTGQPVVVRLTLSFSAGTQPAAAQARAFRIMELEGREFVQLNEISRAMIGPSRDTRYSDLRNMQLDVQVISGDGSVIAFLSSLDNGSGDSILRLD